MHIMLARAGTVPRKVYDAVLGGTAFPESGQLMRMMLAWAGAVLPGNA